MIPAKEFEGELWIKASDHHRAIKTAQRPWVDLTDEQIADYLGDEYHGMSESDLRFFRLGEASAKEKNNG